VIEVEKLIGVMVVAVASEGNRAAMPSSLARISASALVLSALTSNCTTTAE